MKTIEALSRWITPWHGILATVEEAGIVPDCYEETEWRLFWIAGRQSSGTKRFTHDMAMAMACEDCQPDYQLVELQANRCHPIDMGATPLGKAA